MRITAMSALCLWGILFGFQSSFCLSMSSGGSARPIANSEWETKLVSSRRQVRSARLSPAETAAVDNLLRSLAKTLFVEHDPEKAYRLYFADTELSNSETVLSPGWRDFHKGALRSLGQDTRAEAFAVAWNYEYSGVTLALGTSTRLSGSAEHAQRVVDSELDAIRERRHVSEDEFFDALDFESNSDPIVVKRKLCLIGGIYRDLGMEVAKRSNAAILNLHQAQRTE